MSPFRVGPHYLSTCCHIDTDIRNCRRVRGSKDQSAAADGRVSEGRVRMESTCCPLGRAIACGPKESNCYPLSGLFLMRVRTRVLDFLMEPLVCLCRSLQPLYVCAQQMHPIRWCLSAHAPATATPRGCTGRSTLCGCACPAWPRRHHVSPLFSDAEKEM